jgi:hypothetical protein
VKDTSIRATSLATIASLLNNVLRRYHLDVIATLCLLLLDPASTSETPPPAGGDRR